MDGSAEELSPREVIELEALLEPFCPVAAHFGSYAPWKCLPACTICAELLRKHKEAA